MSDLEIVHAYRHLLRQGLRAVQYSKPARFVIQDQLRRAFRTGKRETFDPEAVRRTIWFLKAAAAERGLEHKIVKNLVKVAWKKGNNDRTPWRQTYMMHETGGMKKKKAHDPIALTAYSHYEATIAMLNHTMGLCLPFRS